MHKQQHDFLFSHTVRPYALLALNAVVSEPSGLPTEQIVIDTGLPATIVNSEIAQLNHLGLVSIKDNIVVARMDTLRVLLAEAIPAKSICLSNTSKSA